MHCLLTGRETHDSICLLVSESAGNTGTPVHVHAREDETIQVLEGELQAIVDGTVHSVSVGQAIFLPRGVPHQIRNASQSRSRYNVLCTPSGFEDFVADAGRVAQAANADVAPTSADIQRLREAAPRFGITLLPGF